MAETGGNTNLCLRPGPELPRASLSHSHEDASSPKQYPKEFIEQAVCLVNESLGDHMEEWGMIQKVFPEPSENRSARES